MSARRRATIIARRFLFICLLGTHSVAHGRNKSQVKLEAENLESVVVDNQPCVRLQAKVRFRLEKEKVTILADRAIYYERERVIEAQSNVRIVHKDGTTVSADRLLYEEKSHLAMLRDHVNYKSGNTTFSTDHLDYNLESKRGQFARGGKLVEGSNVLTSMCGYFDELAKEATFDQQVELVNQDCTLVCNTLRYNTATKIVHFKGHTKMASRNGQQTLTTEEGGEYNTSSQEGFFTQGTVKTEEYTLYSDLLRADRARECYTATGHIKLTNKEKDIIISGDHGQYQKREGTAEIHGNALMTKLVGEDLLYLSADTFVVTETPSIDTDGDKERTIHAYHDVRIYKEDLQGRADSLRYQSAESTMYLYGEPIFWSKKNQFSADSARVLLREKSFEEMHMNSNAFVASEDEMGNFNQIQGRDMVAYFEEGKIERIEIDGNAESIYFVIDERGKLQGTNHLKCSHIHINMEEGDITNIAFQLKPIGAFYPPQLFPKKLGKLERFHWRIDERPTKQEVVNRSYRKEKRDKKLKPQAKNL